jgi:hypothetical protein
VLEHVSILDVIKRGGYEASLITTFNATLPFYEEVLLRKLVAAGCRQNVVLMDRSQCGLSWSSEATRPRLAGYAYTLLPIGAPSAFHPKLCILVGPKKASVLIGSHNLTLSGFGYNREITNWIEVAGPKDREGAALLKDAWQMVNQWIELERGKAAESMLKSVQDLAKFVRPLVVNAEPSTHVLALTQAPSGPPLIEQVFDRVSADVIRIAVVGAFFDKELALVGELVARWPNAQVVVGIDPESVQMLASPPTGVARYVDVRKLWPERQGYLHAKMIWFDSGVDSSAFVSGSANPSRPAWMAPTSSGNVEAVLLRLGREAHEVAESFGLSGIFDLEDLDPSAFGDIAERSNAEVTASESSPVPLWSGISSVESGEIRIGKRGHKANIDRAVVFNAEMNVVGEVTIVPVLQDDLIFPLEANVAHVRSCVLYSKDDLIARAMIHHPDIVSASSQTSQQNQIRTALSGLGSSEGDISKVIASVERVIFSDETQKEMESALREHQQKQSSNGPVSGPESLAISVADLPKERKKLRVLKSGDLAYLLDVLLRRLSEGLDSGPISIEATELTEEERIGTEGGEEEKMPDPLLPASSLSDRDIAKAVSRRARALTKRMVEQLSLASADHTRRASAMLQLIAVIALVRELRHLDKTSRWKASGQVLVEEADRRHLLDESIKHLLGSASHMLDEIDRYGHSGTEEGTQLRVLLLWLAWDLGKELTDKIGQIWDVSELHAKLRANAMFLRLIPPLTEDTAARKELESSIFRTVRSTPEAALRANHWLVEHMNFGVTWGKGGSVGQDLRIGGYCRIPGEGDDPHVVVEISDTTVGFWAYDRIRKFSRDRVVAVSPAV